MESYSFHPELFEHGTLAFEALAERGFDWFTHFSSIDLLHEEFGLEVSGVPLESQAREMLRALQETFPDWRYSDVHYRDRERDRGWHVEIFRREPRGRQGYLA